MKLAALIGFFLAFATTGNSGDQGLALRVDRIETGMPQTSYKAQYKSGQDSVPLTGVTPSLLQDFKGWWIVIAVILLMLPLYLLFLLRQRQITVKQMERLRADRKLLFDGAPCGYHSMDELGNFINVNQTLLQWLGYEKDEMVGRMKLSDIVAGEPEEVESQVAALLQGRASGKQMSFKKKSGEQIPVVIKELFNGKEHNFSNRLFYTLDNSECSEALERIKTLDHELESFSYSISHDLRAPLRSIDGYSKILQEDYAAELGDEGKRVLSVVMNNAKRMGLLIDDLLEFGRLGRKNVQRSYISMEAIANAVVQDLLSQSPGRKIDVRVGELHAAFADADMMRQVWLNLLDNAFKFSGKEDLAVIEIDSFKTERGEWCYKIKDNGVGFDMKYAPKLFGVFQRLHKIQDFAGTGVGLAIVKRIISRHGGRVWAEASTGQGAVFYFTIPIEDENT